MGLLLDLVYLAALVLCSPWLLWRAATTGRYREGYAEKLLGRVPMRRGDRPCVWFHAVSVGEVNLLAPLLADIAERFSNWQCVVSTTTHTGMELARRKYSGLTVFYCPMDFTWAVRRAMRRVRPDVLALVELELWPNLIRAARQYGARVAVINGRLSDRSFRGYRRVRWLLGRVVGSIDLVLAQDGTYAERFRALGARAEAVHVTGSMKYDGAQTDRSNPATRLLAERAGIAPDDTIWLAGSTQQPEETIVLDVFRRLVPRWPRLRLVLVPRHPERFDEVTRLVERSGLAFARRSAWGRLVDPPGDAPSKERQASAGCPGGGERWQVLLVDTVGELRDWWGTAHIAFVGGSLGNRGGQNMIEPAAYGAAVSFGPNTRNFRDIVASLLEHEAAVVVRDADELAAFVERCLADPGFADQLGRRAQRLVLRQLGATRRTAELLAWLVEQPAYGANVAAEGLGRHHVCHNCPDPPFPTAPRAEPQSDPRRAAPS